VHGGGYAVFNKTTLDSFPQLLFGGLRFFIVFLITSPFIFKANIPKLQVIISGIVLFLNLFIFHHAIELSDNLIPLILINELNVPFSILLGALFLKEKILLKDCIGILIAITGVAWIAENCFTDFNLTNSTILIIIASFLYACYNLLTKKMSHYNILSFLSQLSLVTAICFFASSFLYEDLPRVSEIKLAAIFSILYSSIICTVMGFYIWFYLLSKYPLGKIVPFTLLSPIFGCLMGVLIFNEKLNLNTILSAILIIIGITLIELKNDRKKLSV
jgi:O-acetylserine/cysteine efflux transporter